MTCAVTTLLFAAAVHAQAPEPPPLQIEPPWYAGLQVADVRLVAPEGGLPEESLEPLLRASQGGALDVQQIRLDLATLFRVGEFSAVEADVERWVATDDAGDPVPAALLTYVVYPAPKVSRVRVDGTALSDQRALLEASRIGVGSVFYAELDAAVVRGRVLERLHRDGFPEASVEVFSVFTEEQGVIEVQIVVVEGEPVTVDALVFAGDLPVGEGTLRRWARKAGVKQGDPLSTDAVTDAQFLIREKLASMGGLLRVDRGWVSARVTPAITGDGHGGTQVTYTVEPGPRLKLDVDGLTWRGRAKAREALGIDERIRLTRGFMEAAPERMERWLRERGYYAAQVDVRLDEDEAAAVQVLRVDVERGPPHLLHRVDAKGNTLLDDEEVRLVMDQVSVEVIRLNRITRPDLERGMGAVRDVYRSRGYLDAQVSLIDLRTTSKLRELNPSGRPPLGRTLVRPFNARARYVIASVNVVEGPLTKLDHLEIEGEARRIDLADLRTRAADLVDRPYSPQSLEALAQEVIERHREAGFLAADARVLREPVGEGRMGATISVETGPLVRLRSVVTRGARATRPRTIRREVDTELGQPVTSTELQRLRRSLYDLGIFRSVETGLIGDEEARDLVITVSERPQWAFEVGAGLATDEGIRGYGRATRRNLWGLAHRLDVFALVGFDWRGGAITDWTPDFASPEWRAAMSYTAPRFPAKGQRLVLEVLLREQLQERTWELTRWGGSLSLDTRFGDRTNLRGGVRFEARQLSEVDPGALLPGEVWVGLQDPLDPAGKSESRPVTWAYVLLLHDLRDDPIQPSRGVLASVLAEASPPVNIGSLTGAVPYVKSEVRASGYVPLGGPVLRLTGEVGYAWVPGDRILPLEDRYQLGGTGSLRGYRRDSIGPQNEVDQLDVPWPDQLSPAIDQWTRTTPTRWVPTGGDLSAKAVAEMLLPFPALGLRAWDGYAAALFVDGGNVWLVNRGAKGVATSDGDTVQAVFDPALRYAVGAGLRISTPVGPLQVDLAFNPEAIRATGEKKALLKDAWREPSARFHLSLGAL